MDSQAEVACVKNLNACARHGERIFSFSHGSETIVRRKLAGRTSKIWLFYSPFWKSTLMKDAVAARTRIAIALLASCRRQPY